MAGGPVIALAAVCIENNRRRAALLHGIDRGPQQPPIGGDRLVRLTEMLLGSIGDRPHGLTSPLVVNVNVGAHPGICLVLLLVRVETVIVVLVFARNIVGQFVELQALASASRPCRREFRSW